MCLRGEGLSNKLQVEIHGDASRNLCCLVFLSSYIGVVDILIVKNNNIYGPYLKSVLKTELFEAFK